MSFVFRGRSFATLASTFLLALAAWGAGISRDGGRVRGFEGVQVGPPDSACTSVTAFEEMPGMVVPFELQSGGRVLVLFQAQVGGFSSTPGARAIVSIEIDGSVVGSAVALATDHDTGLQSLGFNAFSEPLAPGPHTARVLWHTFPSGGTSCVEERSLVVLRG